MNDKRKLEIVQILCAELCQKVGAMTAGNEFISDRDSIWCLGTLFCISNEEIETLAEVNKELIEEYEDDK
jgi:hypothetical protein